MKSHVRVIAMISALVLLPWLVVASDDTQSSTEKRETMKDQYDLLFDRLNAVSASNVVDALTQIGKDIERLALTEKTDLPERQKMRKRKLELWLKLLNACDQLSDPEFDPNDVPQINIAPPPSTGLSSGASPSAIKDPQLRQEYEQAIRLNAEKAKRYHVQKRLHDLDRTWSSKVNAYIKRQYTSEAQDIDEIKVLIDTHVSDKARRSQMMKEIGRPR